MTLHDRILGQSPEPCEGDYYDGFAHASRQASKLAAEADELMREMVNTLAGLDPEQLSPCQQDNVCLVLEKYNSWKGCTQ